MALYHFVRGKSLFVVVFFCALLGDLHVAFSLVVFVSCSGFYDLRCYVTTCVHVEFISNCFFTCKDQALERDRPHQRKKEVGRKKACS